MNFISFLSLGSAVVHYRQTAPTTASSVSVSSGSNKKHKRFFLGGQEVVWV